MFIRKQYEKRCVGKCGLLSLCALFLSCTMVAWGQGAAPSVSAATTLSIRATHLLGFPNTKSNCNGTIAIKENTLQFQRSDKPVTEVKIASIQGVFLGGESKQVGGVPMKVGKVAAPFGSGRVVSLFAHKKYDTLTVEYLDSDGGVHGAIFQLNKGEAERVRNELVTRGVSPNVAGALAAERSSAEVSHETH